ncbi:phage terminase large subunit [Roseococcus pinisoli]|uniref:Phage terminase large subunit n=1 Tax=Roseococcus pinisoli TaxID=2835040 RepID=A0ABS5Q782_9PROT|nr:phage terminase large subunit [Roseococcus pinisoli]MBS7809502.1 phage terminase large subunit [Roseococcus pinisoli]
MTTETPADLLEFVWVWNRLQGLGTPPVHRRILRWLEQEAPSQRRLLMAFRGCGKSTLIGLFCAWSLYRRPELRILVLAAEQSLAGKMVGHVRRIIERHPLCAPLLPERDEAWAADRFTVARPGALRDPSMLAQGLQGNITGARAELVICDDVEVAGNCDTPGKRLDLRERLAETEFVLTPGGTILYVGTPHTEESLYRPGDPFLAGYRRLEVPIEDATGRSAWPERFSEAAIAALRRRVGPLHFQRQMLLQPIAAGAARLDPALLLRYAEEVEYREANGCAQLWLLGRRMASGGGFWDPSFGRVEGGDGSVLAATYTDGEGGHYLHRLAWITQREDAPDDPATQQCRQVAALAQELRLPVLRVETNGLGRFLPALLRREMARAGAACVVVEHASHRAKADRILAAFDPLLAARRLHAHDSVFRTGFVREMAEWRPELRGARDDALDAVSGCLLAEPVRLPALSRVTGPSWRGAG